MAGGCFFRDYEEAVWRDGFRRFRVHDVVHDGGYGNQTAEGGQDGQQNAVPAGDGEKGQEGEHDGSGEDGYGHQRIHG